jgi:hypothetical protein
MRAGGLFAGDMMHAGNALHRQYEEMGEEVARVLAR